MSFMTIKRINKIEYRYYIESCQIRGFVLSWSFHRGKPRSLGGVSGRPAKPGGQQEPPSTSPACRVLWRVVLADVIMLWVLGQPPQRGGWFYGVKAKGVGIMPVGRNGTPNRLAGKFITVDNAACPLAVGRLQRIIKG